MLSQALVKLKRVVLAVPGTPTTTATGAASEPHLLLVRSRRHGRREETVVGLEINEIKEAGHRWSTNLGSAMLAVFGGRPPIDAHKQPSQAFGVGEVKALASFSHFFFNLGSDRISVYRCGFRRLGDKRISLVYFFSL